MMKRFDVAREGLGDKAKDVKTGTALLLEKKQKADEAHAKALVEKEKCDKELAAKDPAVKEKADKAHEA